MASGREKASMSFLVQPKLDRKAVQNIHKQLSSLKLDWSQVVKVSNQSLKELKNITKAAEQFQDALSDGAKLSLKKFTELGDSLEDAHKQAQALRDQVSKAKGPVAKKQAAAELAAVQKTIIGLNQQINSMKSGAKGFHKELAGITRAQKTYRRNLEQAARYDSKTFLDDLLSSIKRGSPKGVISGIGGASAKAAKGAAARNIMDSSDPTALSKATMGLSKALTSFTAAIGAFTIFWQVIKMASEHQTKLNKALVSGQGFVGDMMAGADAYEKTIGKLNAASKASHEYMLQFGESSETTAKVISQFTKESTGSLLMTSRLLTKIGDKDLDKGTKQFARSAVAYGRALGMQADETAAMMGKFVSEAGYGAGQVQDLMGDVVKAAATANMPMTKFMDIFRRVLPDVELYKNRLEELTGTIKLLSKTMSAKDVQKFMDAFAKGFEGTDFKQRLKTVLITGTGFVSKTLEKDFGMKAKAMAKNFNEYVTPDMGTFEDAMKSGTKGMADFIAKAQANAAAQNAEIAGSTIGEAMKLAGYEAARQKGDALSMATATRGAGMYGTYEILKKQSQTFTKGFDGLAEHVIKQTGISESQYESLRNVSQNLEVWRSQLQKAGMTVSKSMNEGLRESIAARKKIEASAVTTDMMKNATEEDLFYAAQMSQTVKEQNNMTKTIEDVAVRHMSLTASIDEKISNVIAFIMEQMLDQLTGILDTLNELFELFIKGPDYKKEAKDRFENRTAIEGVSSERKEQFKLREESLRKLSGQGLSDKDLAEEAAKDYSSADQIKNITGNLQEYLVSQGQSHDAAVAMTEEFQKKASEGDIEGALYELKYAKGGFERALGAVNRASVAQSDIVSEEAKERATKYRREGSAEKKIVDTMDKLIEDESDEIKARDLDTAYANAMGAMEKKGGPAGVVVDPDGKMNFSDDSISSDPNKLGPPVGPGVVTLPGVDIVEDPKASSKPITDAQEEATDTVTDTIKEGAGETVDGLKDTYDGITDVVGILKKGIKYESGFLQGHYKKTVKVATEEAVDKSLAKFSVVLAKILSSEEWRNHLANAGYQVGYELKAGVGDLARMDKDKASNWDEFYGELKDYAGGGHQAGGAIPRDMYTKVHRGEAVLDAMTYESVKRGLRGGANSGITVHMNINAAPNWTRQEFESAVFGVMDKVARRQ